MPTNGNAGAAWRPMQPAPGCRPHRDAGGCAPRSRDASARRLEPSCICVDGLIGDAGRIVGDGRGRTGWFEVSTLKEPYRIEGKKTMGLEIAEQLGWRLPDVIFYPTGGGVGLIGICKALRELQELGWIAPKLPRAGRGAGDRLRADRRGV